MRFTFKGKLPGMIREGAQGIMLQTQINTNSHCVCPGECPVPGL